MRVLLTAVVAAAVAAAPAATVSLVLQSPQNGTTVPLGATIDWSIYVTVSTGDNVGLALVSVNLVQDAQSNPATLDIPPGFESSIVRPMHQFSRPLGVSNPGENGASTGYIGVQRGTPGAMNLIQIGGGQNTFGQPGEEIGTDADVEGGIGQSGPVLVLSGQIPLPSDPGAAGNYTFSLVNGVANVLAAVNPPPALSPVFAADVDLSGGVLAVTMVPEPATLAMLCIAAIAVRAAGRMRA